VSERAFSLPRSDRTVAEMRALAEKAREIILAADVPQFLAAL